MDIKKDILQSLLSLHHENCGFIFGKNKIEYIFVAKNISLDYNKFKIGFFDIIKLIILLIKTNSNKICIFHVHENNLPLSFDDYKNMLSNFPYLLINDNLNFFIKNKKELKRLNYRIIQ